MSEDSQQNKKDSCEANSRGIIQISSMAAYGGKGILLALCRDGSLWYAEQLGGEFKEWTVKIPTAP